MERLIRVGALQMERASSKAKNLEKALNYLDMAAKERCDAVCLPEYFFTGLPQKSWGRRALEKLAEPIPGPTTEVIGKKAKEHDMYVVAGTIVERAGKGVLYNTAPLIGPNGDVVGKVPKDGPENAPVKAELDCGISPGPAQYPVFKTKKGDFGIMVDMDACAPEIPRILGLKGAEVIFWPVSWPALYLRSVHLLGTVASFIADCFTVVANDVGYWRNTEWGDVHVAGGSGIIHLRQYNAYVPDFAEGIAATTINLEAVKERRKFIAKMYPLWRRPETYKLLTSLEAEKKTRRK